jgi:hypothetical protein
MHRRTFIEASLATAVVTAATRPAADFDGTLAERTQGPWQPPPLEKHARASFLAIAEYTWTIRGMTAPQTFS